MDEYKQDVWHGWNGGECPVHPKTEVQAICRTRAGDWKPFIAGPRIAGQLNWGPYGETAYPIIAFRVVKEYREPREWWIIPGTVHAPFSAIYYDTKPQVGAVRVREVLDDEEGV